MASRTVLFAIVRGEEHRDYCQVMLRSLRAYGRFRGDVVVFCDTPFAAEHPIRFLPVPKVAAHDTWIQRANVWNGHHDLLRWYDNVVYSDTDILYRQPLSKWLGISDHGLRVFTEPGSRTYEAFHRYYLTVHEIMRYASKKPINCGFFCGKRESYISECKVWADFFAKHHNERYASEQSALLALHLRKQITLVPYPAEWCYYPVMGKGTLTSETMIDHLAGFTKNLGFMKNEFESWDKLRQPTGTAADDLY